MTISITTATTAVVSEVTTRNGTDPCHTGHSRFRHPKPNPPHPGGPCGRPCPSRRPHLTETKHVSFQSHSRQAQAPQPHWDLAEQTDLRQGRMPHPRQVTSPKLSFPPAESHYSPRWPATESAMRAAAGDLTLCAEPQRQGCDRASGAGNT